MDGGDGLSDVEPPLHQIVDEPDELSPSSARRREAPAPCDERRTGNPAVVAPQVVQRQVGIERVLGVPLGDQEEFGIVGRGARSMGVERSGSVYVYTRLQIGMGVVKTLRMGWGT